MPIDLFEQTTQPKSSPRDLFASEIAPEKQTSPQTPSMFNDLMTMNKLLRNNVLPNIAQGAIQGANDLGDLGNKAWLSVANMMGADKKLPVNYDQYKDFSKGTSDEYEASPAGQSVGGFIGRAAVNTAPYAFLPGGAEGGLLRRMGTLSASMAIPGAIKDVAEQNKFPSNTLLGATLGSISPPLIEAGKFAFKPIKSTFDYFFPKNAILQKNADIIGEDLPNVINAKEAGQRIGFQMTPAEASGNPLLAALQGSSGRTEYGSNKMFQFGKEHLNQQSNAINNLINDISPNDASAADSVQKTADQIITNRKKNLINIAQPYYDKAFLQKVNPNDLKSLVNEDPNIGMTINDVLKDRNYSAELKGYAPNSIKVLDLAKRRFDANIEQAKNFGNNDLVRVLTNSKNKLVNSMDTLSPVYSKARSIYSEEMPAINAIENGKIGQIANYSSNSVEGLSQSLFSPARYNINKFNSIRDQIYNKNPTAWNQLARNEMERRLDKTESTGNDFYSKILKGNRDFNQFLSAVKYIPGAQQKLIDMRTAFKTIINPLSGKASAALSKTGMLGKRDSILSIKDYISNFFGGRHDKAYVDFITNPNWDKQLMNFMKSPKMNMGDKIIRFNNLLNKIGSGNIDISNPSFENQNLSK
jgi:hypothetical protein